MIGRWMSFTAAVIVSSLCAGRVARIETGNTYGDDFTPRLQDALLFANVSSNLGGRARSVPAGAEAAPLLDTARKAGMLN